jgi:DNA mismatch repair protein MutL
MAKIKLLSDTLASQVAAGEVVERPASVVKELIENSIDAGARNIEIQIRRGGISSIQIADDGCGMNKTDALMSLERHATSKIRETEDLASILTMGFRGEAMPSIASVSKFRMTTRETNALAGTEILVNGGKLASVKEAGEAPGTQIEVRSLFFNIPARRKFLRTENTEFSHIEHQVRIHAIAHPHIRFSLVHNDRTVFHLPGTESLFERIRGLAGNELASRLLEIPDQTVNGLCFHGFIGEPGLSRSNRSLQMIFLNRRPIEGAILQYALREGYHTALMKGQHPVTFLFIEMNPSLVDINVHPAKREVRFHDGNNLRATLVSVIANTLESFIKPATSTWGNTGTVTVEEDSSTVATTDAPQHVQPTLVPEAEQRSLRKDWADQSPTSTGDWPPELEQERTRTDITPPEPSASSSGLPNAEKSTGPTSKVPKPADFRILGVLGKLYVLMENDQGLVLMDQHAAHERVLFEQMRRRMEDEGVPTQQLLMPTILEMTPKEFDLVSQNLPTLRKLGIGAETFGSNTIKVDYLPTFVDERDGNTFINDVLEELRRDTTRMSTMRLGEDMVATTVCRHAVKANDFLHLKELEKLLEDMLLCDLPFCCPHGRPTLIQISYAELERKFGRVV